MPSHNYAKARRLRAEMSLPEVLLWQYLRKKPLGIKFRRQHRVGEYVIDFYSPASKLGIEIDGIAHEMGDRPDRDAIRDGWLAMQGIEILRIPAKDVLKSVEQAAHSIILSCRDRI